MTKPFRTFLLFLLLTSAPAAPQVRLASGDSLPVRAALVGRAIAAYPASTQSGNPPEFAQRHSPSWARDAVIYEIFPRDFSPTGDLPGVTARLDELHRLGVTVLWLMPIHPIGELKRKGRLGSPYSIRDYYAINSDYGSKDDLRRLVMTAHKLGMKVIMDLVAGHTSWDSVMMKWPQFYKHDSKGRIIPPEPDWSDVAALDYSNPELRRYMIEMMEYWVRGFEIDGFRCDAADRIPVQFWVEARAALDKISTDLFLLNEGERPEFLASAFNADYSWQVFHAIEKAIAGHKPASFVRETWEKERAKFPEHSIHLRFIDNHDERRAINNFGPRATLAASALIFTIDGIPLIYNGMEAANTAQSGAPELFEKRPIEWQDAGRHPEFERAYRELIELRRSTPALTTTDLEWLDNSDPSSVLTFVRRTAETEVLVAINLSGKPFTGSINPTDTNAGLRGEGSGSRFTEITPEVFRQSTVPNSTSNDKESSIRAREKDKLSRLTLGPWGVRIFSRSVH